MLNIYIFHIYNEVTRIPYKNRTFYIITRCIHQLTILAVKGKDNKCTIIGILCINVHFAVFIPGVKSIHLLSFIFDQAMTVVGLRKADISFRAGFEVIDRYVRSVVAWGCYEKIITGIVLPIGCFIITDIQKVFLPVRCDLSYVISNFQHYFIIRVLFYSASADKNRNCHSSY